jgi:flagellar basal body rod protein FlgG
VKVIQAQRAFQSNLTVIRTADEIESYTNQLRQ